MMPSCASCHERFDSRSFFVHVHDHGANRDDRLCRSCWGEICNSAIAVIKARKLAGEHERTLAILVKPGVDELSYSVGA